MSDLILLDANVLIYSTVADAPQHETSRRLCNEALAGRVGSCLVPQVLFEFFSTVTNPKRMTPPRTPAAAWREVRKFASALDVLAVPPDLVERVAALAGSLGVTAHDVFDVQIAATMLANDVTRIYTFDSAVFGRVPGITVIVPS